MTSTTHDAIAIRAYLIWQDEGRPNGRHQDHWFTAEAVEQQATVQADAPVMNAEIAPNVATKPAKKAVPVRKPAAAKKAAPAKAAAPKAPAETVVAAAALTKTPRAARSRAKSASITH